MTPTPAWTMSVFLPLSLHEGFPYYKCPLILSSSIMFPITSLITGHSLNPCRTLRSTQIGELFVPHSIIHRIISTLRCHRPHDIQICESFVPFDNISTFLNVPGQMRDTSSITKSASQYEQSYTYIEYARIGL